MLAPLSMAPKPFVGGVCSTAAHACEPSLAFRASVCMSDPFRPEATSVVPFGLAAIATATSPAGVTCHSCAPAVVPMAIIDHVDCPADVTVPNT